MQATLVRERFGLSRRRHGPVVRAPDLKVPGSSPTSATLVYSQLVCLLPVGIFNMLCSI